MSGTPCFKVTQETADGSRRETTCYAADEIGALYTVVAAAASSLDRPQIVRAHVEAVADDAGESWNVILSPRSRIFEKCPKCGSTNYGPDGEVMGLACWDCGFTVPEPEPEKAAEQEVPICDECGHPPARGNVIYEDSGRRPLCPQCNPEKATGKVVPKEDVLVLLKSAQGCAGFPERDAAVVAVCLSHEVLRAKHALRSSLLELRDAEIRRLQVEIERLSKPIREGDDVWARIRGFRCSGCHNVFSVKDNMADGVLRCPQCDFKYEVREAPTKPPIKVKAETPTAPWEHGDDTALSELERAHGARGIIVPGTAKDPPNDLGRLRTLVHSALYAISDPMSGLGGNVAAKSAGESLDKAEALLDSIIRGGAK